jgi:methionyl-tRNA formyltransferase
MSSSVVFLGTSAFAVPSLKALTEAGFDVKLVISQPDRPVGRKQVLTPPPVKAAAAEHLIPVLQPEKMNALFKEGAPLKERPDFLVVVSYGQILSQEILDWPKVAAVNVHASLLPLLRGASPLQHSILQHFTETGVTVQKMAKELDAGPVLAQVKVTMDPRETFTTLHDRLAVLGATLLTETLKHPLKEQVQDHTKATFCGKLTKEDGICDPHTMTAEEIDRRVRALSPWPGVTIRGNKILASSLTSGNDALAVSCRNGTALFVTRIQPPSGKPMTGNAFSLGHSLLS